MTNKELQELLKQYPDDDEILLENENGTYSSVYKAEAIVLANYEVNFNDAYLVENRVNHCIAILQECFDQLLEERERLKNGNWD